jgi:hypothetical protein
MHILSFAINNNTISYVVTKKGIIKMLNKFFTIFLCLLLVLCPLAAVTAYAGDVTFPNDSDNITEPGIVGTDDYGDSTTVPDETTRAPDTEPGTDSSSDKAPETNAANNTGKVIGIIIAIVAAVVIVVLAILFWPKKAGDADKKRK